VIYRGDNCPSRHRDADRPRNDVPPVSLVTTGEERSPATAERSDSVAGPAGVEGRRFSRRSFLRATAVGAVSASLMPAMACTAPSPASLEARADELFSELDAKILKGMKSFAIPGVAVGVLFKGREYVKGYGATNVDYPVPVNGDTVFRIGSTTKTFTGTTLMRLVDQGRVSLDATVRTYLPDFAVSDPSVSAQVTVRQLLNHSSGWLGDDLQDFGPGDDALARYVASMTRLPQLTPLGTTFAYNNAGLCVAGRIAEVVTGTTYEDAVQNLVLGPLQLAHTKYFSDDIVGFNVAASHDVVNGKAVVDPSFWRFPRSCDSTGDLISSARDQLRYARFHLGDGTAPNGTRLLTQSSLEAMRSNPGPGGTLQVELTGMGLTWMLRPSAEGVVVVQHGGNWTGQSSGFMMVPSRGFAMTLLTNSTGGSGLANDLFADDWALRRFAGVSNVPATPQHLDPGALAPYEGNFISRGIDGAGTMQETVVELKASNGTLQGTQTAGDHVSNVALAFYRPNYVLDLDAEGQPAGTRADFVRGSDGSVAWFRTHGRLFGRQ
jgi:CubicO group peptidase (beta-lactamase class C family)